MMNDNKVVCKSIVVNQQGYCKKIIQIQQEKWSTAEVRPESLSPFMKS